MVRRESGFENTGLRGCVDSNTCRGLLQLRAFLKSIKSSETKLRLLSNASKFGPRLAVKDKGVIHCVSMFGLIFCS